MSKRLITRGATYRNRARGLLNQAREHGYGVDDSMRSLRLRMTLRSSLLEARASLSPTRYDENLSWLFNQTELAARALPNSVGQGLLYRNIYALPVPIETELGWIAARLASAHQAIASHLEARRDASLEFLAGNRESFFARLDKVEAAIGDSHWLIALRLAALQTFDGIEGQKAYLAQLRKRSNSGLTAAFAFHTSVRNEQSVAFPWFVSGIKARRFSKDYPEHKIYLEFALLATIPADVDDIATILRVEQAHTDIDLYETSVSIAQSLATRRNPAAVHQALCDFVQRLSRDIADPRLQKLRFALGVSDDGHQVATDERALIELLTNGTAAVQPPSPEEWIADPASIVWRALADSVGREASVDVDSYGTPLEMIYNQLVLVAGRMENFEDVRLQLVKHARNFHGLTYGGLLASITDAIAVPTVNDLPERLADASTASTTYGLLELLLAKKLGIPAQAAACEVVRAFIDAFYGSGECPSLSAPARAVCSLRTAIRSGNADHLYSFFDSARRHGHPFARNWSRVAALEIFSANNDLQSSLRLIGSCYASAKEGDAPLPTDVALGPFKPKVLSQVGDEITTPLALEAWRRTSDTDTKRRYVRMAFNQFIRSTGLTFPSQIPMETLQSAPELYTAFLRDVCVPDLMDMSSGAESSVKLYEERRAVCAVLRQLDPSNSNRYDDEILELTQTLGIWEGLMTVDGSRIHVEEAAFTQAAAEELQGSFDRYVSLVKAGVGVSANFDEVVRNLSRDPTFAEGMSIPTNEADQLLGDMVRRMKVLFLQNSIFGLHGFLSRRIRHGSLIGHLRGPVERHRLITQMSGSGIYSVNTHWIQRCSAIDATCRLRMERAFAEFSRAFDRELISLKDEKLHVRDEGHSAGVFDIVVSAGALALIRSAIKTDLTLRGLIKSTVVTFWQLLSPSLKSAERLVKTDFQKRATELFQRLHSSVTPCLTQDSEAAEFTAAVRLATEETQFQVKTVASWFDKSAEVTKLLTYTLFDAIEIGVKSAKAAIAQFDPYVIKACDNLAIPAINLQFVADIVLVALGNIYKYSKTGDEPRVDINATISDRRDALTLSVSSPVAPGVRCAASESILSTIRRNIENRSYESFVGVEGNSGFYKLAALAHQSQVGAISFGFTDDLTFELRVTLSIMLDRDLEQGSSSEGPIE